MGSRKKHRDNELKNKSFFQTTYLMTLENGKTVDFKFDVPKTRNEKTCGEMAVRKYNESTTGIKAVFGYCD